MKRGIKGRSRPVGAMRRFLTMSVAALAGGGLAMPATAQDFVRTIVDASVAEHVSVTVYRDPNRGNGAMNLDWLNGFALVSETRTVTLPPGESRIRFDGVAESMVAVSAIVTGLPEGTIEKNRNAEILSPAALVDGTLGNRVTITRTNPATGAQQSESAIVRTRADGGLVLQTAEGFEAVQCAGIPEKLTFDRVPDGLSANPVYTVDTRSAQGGTYTVRLTYLASGFDWSAHYVATFAKAGLARKRTLDLTAWLTVANANGQGFADAELLAVAGKLEITSDYRGMSQPPRGEPLRLTCYPLGSTSDGIPEGMLGAPPPPAPPPVMMSDEIIVTGARKMEAVSDQAMAPVMAVEEALGDLKLYRVPMTVNVAAKAQKQVAFLHLDAVEGQLVHRADCSPDRGVRAMLADVVMRSRNLEKYGLGRALPAGGVTVFEPSAYGPLLLSEDEVDDYAIGQELEIGISPTSQVKVSCALTPRENPHDFNLHDGKAHAMQATIANGSREEVEVEVRIGNPAQWELRYVSRKVAMQDGFQIIRLRVSAGKESKLTWSVRRQS
ncbi:hypothetical protein EKN06_12640 [Croceicoccus ponticola]|uniref:DUF4139 domain-containing protein n=1 Tax=Croceicoccus ponticola TaxID=2217664 RepID=A0A437GVF7_9SPHN|nr:hypothetical protein [Croceicoccus ponticola]RVQ65770.1 hypothetical protein EKN06_12640 [Croceicoccus ponticola]